ncbi:MAG: DUF1329 domain-containing protein, partial [Gammaproteobacteria bacterium]|nr:DUF1329 domain-containing protein [Gammaproteobacteria bacterium]
MMSITRTLVLAVTLGVTMTAPAGELSPEAIARLGADLTPVGAERAGSPDGTIPAWEGGITAPPAGYAPGMHHPDPFPDDAVLFTIDQTNVDQHRERLTAGQQALIETYQNFYMNVYPTRRSASMPRRIYEATRRVAATARLSDGGNGVTGATVGIPFPIPESGLEVIWNHLLRYR